jgi:hypothetical protein
MFYKAKVAVCSEIRTKHMNAVWAPCRIFLMLNLVYVNLPLGFKRLKSCTIVLICTLNGIGERPHPCLTPLFILIGSDIVSPLNLKLTFVFL